MSNRKSTSLIELVETHNIMLSLNRLVGPPYDCGDRWKRALCHAISMSDARENSIVRKIREALELP